MYTYKFLSIVAFSGLVATAPIEDNLHQNLTLDTRDDSYPDSYCLAGGAKTGGPKNGQTCITRPPAAFDWIIYLPQWGNPNSPDLGGCQEGQTDCCANGFLDNLRGQCGAGIINWGCDIAGDGNKDSVVSFTSPITCGTSQVQNAFWAASQKSGLTCYNNEGDCADNENASDGLAVPEPADIAKTVLLALGFPVGGRVG